MEGICLLGHCVNKMRSGSCAQDSPEQAVVTTWRQMRANGKRMQAGSQAHFTSQPEAPEEELTWKKSHEFDFMELCKISNS